MQRNFRLITITTALLIAAIAAAQAKDNGGRIKDALPAGINLNDAKVVEIKDDSGRVVLSGTFANS